MAEKKAKIPKLSPEQAEKLKAFIKSNEFLWWYDRQTMKAVKLLVEKKLGFSVRPGEFRSILLDNIEWFRKVRRPKESEDETLTSEQWDRLKRVVDNCKEMIASRGSSHAAAVVSIYMRCNPMLLMGLPKRLHYWKKQ